MILSCVSFTGKFQNQIFDTILLYIRFVLKFECITFNVASCRSLSEKGKLFGLQIITLFTFKNDYLLVDDYNTHF